MEISRKLVDQLTEELNAFSAAGRQMVLNAVTNAEWSDIAELRAIMAEVMEMICGEMADLAAARTAEFYDSVREVSTGFALGALAESTRKPAATEGAVRALVQSVVDSGSTERFARELGDRVDYEVKKSAGDCIEFNAKRDPLKPRYARVPAGRETCKFCIMLASRGFVYHSEKTAGGTAHWHPNCDCRIVPGFDGVDIEGYDAAELYQQYLDNIESGFKPKGKKSGSGKRQWRSTEFENLDGFKQYVSAADSIEDLQKRCEKATAEWDKTTLRKGDWDALRRTVMEKRAELAGEKPPGLISFDDQAEPMKKELEAGNWLAARGYDVHFRATRSAEGKKTSDVYLNGEAWEIKQPKGSGKRNISNQFNEAKGQSGRLVIDTSVSPWSLNDIEAEAKRQLHLRSDFDEVILIGPGYFRHVRKN